MKSSTATTVIVVTGASGGVGRATARRLAEHPGVKLALAARGKTGLEGARAEAEQQGAQALAIETDMADPTQVGHLADRVEQEWGPIDIWINAAMTTVFGPFMNVTPEEYKRVTEVTYLGYVYATQAALRSMLPRKHGTIVQVGSSVAYRGIPLQTAYSGAKHAMQGFSEALREELIHDKAGIKLTMVHLPAVNTPQFSWCKNTMQRRWQPIPPIYDPGVAARAIAWAAFHPHRDYYVTGSTYKAVWADKLIPGLVDKYLGKTGFDSQLCDGENDPNRPNNLWRPIDEDRGSRGEFTARSRMWSLQVWAMTHPVLARVAAAVVPAALVLLSRGVLKRLGRSWAACCRCCCGSSS